MSYDRNTYRSKPHEEADRAASRIFLTELAIAALIAAATVAVALAVV